MSKRLIAPLAIAAGIAGIAFAVTRDRSNQTDESSATGSTSRSTTTVTQPTTTTTTPPTTTEPSRPQPVIDAHAGVLLIGDSLSHGTRPHVAGAFPGRQTEVKAFPGITLDTGMQWYREHPNKPPIVLMGLFTNNSPDQVDELEAAVDETIADARERQGRVVWATIEHPAGNGHAYDGVNQLLRDKARDNADVMRLVDWSAAMDEHPELLDADGVHSPDAGYQLRARLFAEAALS